MITSLEPRMQLEVYEWSFRSVMIKACMIWTIFSFHSTTQHMKLPVAFPIDFIGHEHVHWLKVLSLFANNYLVELHREKTNNQANKKKQQTQPSVFLTAWML